MRNYKNIRAWQHADDLTFHVYHATRAFPRDELYGITSQVRRSASSVASNIAEGALRDSKKEYLHFLYIARASLGETEYFLHLANRLEYLNDQDHEQFAGEINATFSILNALIKEVRKEAGALSSIVPLIACLLPGLFDKS